MSEIITLPLAIFDKVEHVDSVTITTLWSDGDSISFKVEEN